MDNYTTGRKKAWPALDYEGMERVIEAVMQDARNGDKDAREWLLEYERIRTRGHKTGNDKVMQDKAMQAIQDNAGFFFTPNVSDNERAKIKNLFFDMANQAKQGNPEAWVFLAKMMITNILGDPAYHAYNQQQQTQQDDAQ